MSPEYFLIPMLMSQFNNIASNLTTSVYFIDCLLVLITIVIIFTIDISIVKDDITTKLRNRLKNRTENSIVMVTTEDSKTSIKMKSIMFYISKLKEKSIYCLREKTEFAWSPDDEGQNERTSEYIIDQTKNFKLDTDVYGIIKEEKKEKSRNGDRYDIDNYSLLRIYTKNKTLIELQEWVESRVSEYKKYLRSKTSDTQLLINISQQKNKKELNEIKIEGIPWESNITFDNSYFHMKYAIVKKIDFFLSNKQWYVERGIPYNLGILLYGEPGCGKTRFIKQLMNHTKRHAIDIKLNDCFDFNELKKIIYRDDINDEYIIPQNKRIIIFEDIDSMGDVVKDRNKRKSSKENSTKTKKTDDTSKNEILDLLLSKSTPSTNNNNNLSFLLNILDGLNECNGRIIVMTTNKMESLDKALIRPGRIDIMVEFKKSTRYDILMMILNFWKDSNLNITLDMIRDDLEYKYTSAEVINIFRSTDTFDEIQDEFIKK